MQSYWGNSKPPPGSQLDLSHSITKNLEMWHICNEGAGSLINDLTPYKRNGIITPVAAVAPGLWKGGNFGHTLKFNGSTQYVNIPSTHNIPVSGTQPYSFSFWMYNGVAAGQAGAISLANTDNTSGGGTAWEISWSFSTTNALRYNTSAPSPVSSGAWDSPALPASRWVHVVCTDDGTGSASAIQFWFNDRKVTTTRVVTPNPVTKGTSNLTTSWGGSSTVGSYYNGWMDNVMIWSRVLPDSQIRALYSAPFSAVVSPIWRRFFIPSGSSVVNNLTLSATGVTALTYTKTAGWVRTISDATSASAIRQTGAIRSITKIGTASNVKSISETKSVSSAASTASVRGTNTIKSVSTAATGSLVRSIGKVLSSTATGIASFVKQIGAIRSVSSATSTTNVKSIGTTKNVSVTATGSQTKSAGKVFSLNSACSTLLSRVTNKAQSVVSATSTILVRSTNKTLSIAKTCTAILAEGLAYLKTLTVSSAASSSLIRSIGKILSGTSAGSVSNPKSINATRSITSPTSTSNVKGVSRVLLLSTTATASMVKSFVKVLSATATATGSLVRSVGKVCSTVILSVPVTTKGVAKNISVSATIIAVGYKNVAKTFLATTTVSTLMTHAAAAVIEVLRITREAGRHLFNGTNITTGGGQS